MQSPSPNGNLVTVKPKTGLRSSQESLGSDISNKSSGSHGSKGSKGSSTRGDVYGPRQILHPRPVDHGEASYVPTVTNLKVSPHQEKPPSAPQTPVAEMEANASNQDMSFSTFKKPPPGHRPSLPNLKAKPPTGQLGDSPTHPGQYNSLQDSARRPSQKSSESLDRLLEECTSHMEKRNSIEGGSSISSSGSGDTKLKRPKPPAPPKRSNSTITTNRDEQHVKTATIGRKKSMKQFREEMKLVRQEMQAAMATTPPPQAPVVKSSDIPEGYATIKRSPSRKASQPAVYMRSNSNEESSGVPRRPNSGGNIPTHDLSQGELDQMHQAATRPLHLGNFSPASSGQSTPSSASTPSTFTPTSKPPPVAQKPADRVMKMAHHQIPPKPQQHASPQQTPSQQELFQHAPPSEGAQAGYSSSTPTPGDMELAAHVPHQSCVSQRKDIPPSPVKGAFKMPDIPPPKVPHGSASGNSASYDRIEASLRESMRGSSRTPNFPSTSDTASISSGSTSISTGSSDSGLPRTKGDRPSSVEMILKRQSGGEESANSGNPLDGIWRPRSRHFPTQNSEEAEDIPDTAHDDGKPMVTANVTFRSLKQQFLDDEKAPKGLITARRPSRKLEHGEELQQRRSFTDMDEHRQSPICKNAPVSFDTLIQEVQSGRTESTPPVDLHQAPPVASKKPTKPPVALPPSVKSPVASPPNAKPPVALPPNAKPPVALPPNAKPPVALPPHVQAKTVQQQAPLNNNTYDKPSQGDPSGGHHDFPPPPAVSDLPPPPPPQQQYPPHQPDLPPPPPPSSFPPPPHSEAPFPPPPAAMLNTKPSSQPPALHMAPSAVPQSSEPPRLPSMSNLPPPPSVPPATYKKSPSKSKQPPQAPPKKKNSSHRQPVVSEGWDSSDTIKRKPPVATPPSVSQNKPKPMVKPPSPTKPKLKPMRTPPNKPKVVPSSEDVDIYSQDLDMMDSLADTEDVVDSDSSETMESGLSGFENENTDTIKKQPVRLSPTKTKEESAADSVEAQLEALKMTMELGNSGQYDLGGDAKQRRASRDSLGLGEGNFNMQTNHSCTWRIYYKEGQVNWHWNRTWSGGHSHESGTGMCCGHGPLFTGQSALPSLPI